MSGDVNALTDIARLRGYLRSMEWMLLVADEFDDACSSLALCWLGARRDILLMLAGILGAGAVLVAFVLGAGPLLLCVAAVLSFSLALSSQVFLRSNKTV
jgi:hypothetical protein